MSRRRYLPEVWQNAGTTSDRRLVLTPAEHPVDRLSETRERDEVTEGAGDLVIDLNAFPQPGTVLAEEDR